MAKVYTVVLGESQYPLAYGPQEAIALKKRFGRPVKRLILEDVMGMVEQEKPGGKPGEKVWLAEGMYDLEVQVAFLHAGIVAGGAKKVTEDEVMKAVAARMKDGKDMGDIIEPVYKAALLSGITGTSYDLEAAMEAETPEGKG